jgi:predicted DNA-binding transcriptional regulator
MTKHQANIVSISAMLSAAAFVLAGYYIFSLFSESNEAIKAREIERQRHVCEMIGGTPVETGRGYMRRCAVSGYVISEVAANRIYDEMARRKVIGY